MTFILAYLDELSWLLHPDHGGDPLLGLRNSFAIIAGNVLSRSLLL